MRAPDTYTLVADIGGTNTRVALAEGPNLLTETVRRYPNRDYAGLETVLRAFIAEEDNVDCKGACVALAGPVAGGKGTLTNLDWEIDEASLKNATGAEKACLLNDLQAQGHSLGALPEGSVRALVRGSKNDDHAAKKASKLVIGVGTGFNIAPVFETPSGRYVPPSESGHANLPIRTEQELELMRFFETAHGFPAVEDMLSGRGLERVYLWLSEQEGARKECAASDIMAGFEAGNDSV
ncbi:MAG: glucokinase, partial [Pseudomonadota bacterium]